MHKWYETEVCMKNVVISSRVRFARNLKNYCFHQKIKDEDAKILVSEIMNVKTKLEELEGMEYHSYQVNKLTENEKATKREYLTMTPLLSEKKQMTGLLISQDECVSIMINEEDHLHIQAVTSGMSMAKAFERAEKIDDLMSEKFEYAFDEKFGYLTSSPLNVGTGLKASYLLYLPALTMAGKISKLAEEIEKYGVKMRGIFGEASENLGSVYEFSNKRSLGMNENEIIENLTQVVKQAVIQEKKRREYLLTVSGDDIEDKVFRSYGVLKYAKRLNMTDALTLLSQLKFGYDTDLIKLNTSKTLLQLMLEIQPATLQRIIGKNLESKELEYHRAEYLNRELPELML